MKKTSLAAYATPAIQAMALQKLETTLKNDMKEVEDLRKSYQELPEGKEKNYKIGEIWMDIWLAHVLPEPEQVCQLLQRLTQETGNDGNPVVQIKGDNFIPNLKKYLSIIREKNSIQDLQKGIFYIPKSLE